MKFIKKYMNGLILILIILEEHLHKNIQKLHKIYLNIYIHNIQHKKQNHNLFVQIAICF